MKAARSMTKQERKIMEKQIQRGCVEVSNKYELDYDTMQIFVQFFHKAWPLEEIIDYHRVMVKERDELKEFYEADDKDPDIHFFAMRLKLKEKGIDVEDIRNKVMSEKADSSTIPVFSCDKESILKKLKSEVVREFMKTLEGKLSQNTDISNADYQSIIFDMEQSYKELVGEQE